MLELDEVAADDFMAQNPGFSWTRLFGGQLLAQAIMAAARTVQGQRLHSLHSYFPTVGDSSQPFRCKVERLRDGRSFALRRVDTTQGKPVFTMIASFHATESGFEHGPAMPPTPGPDQAMSEAEWLKHSAADAVDNLHAFWTRERPFELRPVDWQAFVTRRAATPSRRVWMRANIPLPDDALIHQAMLAYISDYALLDAALLPHGYSAGDPGMQAASIDHAMWFHRSFRADQWLLFHEEGLSAAEGRGFVRGAFYDEDGRLIATVVQEGLMRRRG